MKEARTIKELINTDIAFWCEITKDYKILIDKYNNMFCISYITKYKHLRFNINTI